MKTSENELLNLCNEYIKATISLDSIKRGEVHEKLINAICDYKMIKDENEKMGLYSKSKNVLHNMDEYGFDFEMKSTLLCASKVMRALLSDSLQHSDGYNAFARIYKIYRTEKNIRKKAHNYEEMLTIYVNCKDKETDKSHLFNMQFILDKVATEIVRERTIPKYN